MLHLLTIITIILTIMGNNAISRAARYSITQNERQAVQVLHLSSQPQATNTPLHWFRLDDGVMGGQSVTDNNSIGMVRNEECTTGDPMILHFTGTINTNGGGFCSIRAKLPPGTLATRVQGLKLRYRGDGKTYKVLLGTGERGGPFGRTPSWQCDLPTTKRHTDEPWDEVMIPFDQLRPSFGGGPRIQPTDEERSKYVFDAASMQEIGLMLSLKLSDGRPNPPATFGTGIFDFALQVQSIATY